MGLCNIYMGFVNYSRCSIILEKEKILCKKIFKTKIKFNVVDRSLRNVRSRRSQKAAVSLATVNKYWIKVQQHFYLFLIQNSCSVLLESSSSLQRWRNPFSRGQVCFSRKSVMAFHSVHKVPPLQKKVTAGFFCCCSVLLCFTHNKQYFHWQNVFIQTPCVVLQQKQCTLILAPINHCAIMTS